jgi:hypothetical protein
MLFPSEIKKGAKEVGCITCSWKVSRDVWKMDGHRKERDYEVS